MNSNFNNGLKVLTAFIKRNARQILIGFIAILGIVYIILTFAAPKKKINQINREFPDSLQAIQYNREYSYSEDPDLFELYKEKVFLLSRLNMAGSDSIGLVVNLRDSILNLEIHGLNIHTARIGKIKISRIFGALDRPAYLAFLSLPYTAIQDRATIKKEPIVVKRAPKDTIEAAKSAIVPDSLRFGPAYVTLILNHDIRLGIYQERTGLFMEPLRKFIFISCIRLGQSGINLWQMIRFRIPDYKPEIRIYISKEDLITIYRALPYNSKVVIRI
jgi:hypothetical protein